MCIETVAEVAVVADVVADAVVADPGAGAADAGYDECPWWHYMEDDESMEEA